MFLKLTKPRDSSREVNVIYRTGNVHYLTCNQSWELIPFYSIQNTANVKELNWIRLPVLIGCHLSGSRVFPEQLYSNAAGNKWPRRLSGVENPQQMKISELFKHLSIKLSSRWRERLSSVSTANHASLSKQTSVTWSLKLTFLTLL